MSRLILLVLMTMNAFSMSAKIDYNINKYGVMIVYFVDDDSLTTELFKSDWDKAIQIAASEKKVKQIQLREKNGGMLGWANKTNLSSLYSVFDNIVKDFSKFDKIEITYGDSVRTSITIPAQYHSDTYINGKLESEYSSDWTQGYFAPKTSTYKSGRDTYTTKTYYTPVRYKYSWTRPVKETKLIQKGETIRLREIYK